MCYFIVKNIDKGGEKMNFKQHRVSNNLTQEQVAQDVGVQRTTVAKWESGKSRPRAELLPKLAKLFGCSIEELLVPGGPEKTA